MTQMTRPSQALGNLPDSLTALTLKQIADMLDVSYDRLLGFANASGVKAAVGALDLPGVKGARYTDQAAQMFANLIAAQDAGLVTPKTAGAWLGATERDDSHSANGLMPQSISDGLNGQLARLPIEVLEEAFARALLRVLPPVEDRLLDAAGAAELLCCAPRSVGRYVRPVRRGRWRLSDIRIHIRELGH